MQYNSIYDFITEKRGLEQDRRMIEIAEIIHKRFNTVWVKLQRSNFSQLEKDAIMTEFRKKGCEINSQEEFFTQNEEYGYKRRKKEKI